MQHALLLAQKAATQGEVPVGALVVHNQRIIGQGWNKREQLPCATAHAEILAIQVACRTLGQWRLVGCALYVTLEPCFMCAGAIVSARLDRVIYGASDPKAGAVESLAKLLHDGRLNHQCSVVEGGILSEECGKALKEFFQKKRKNI